MPHLRQVAEEQFLSRLEACCETFERALLIAFGHPVSPIGKAETDALHLLSILAPSLQPSDVDGSFVSFAQNPWWTLSYRRLLTEIEYFKIHPTKRRKRCASPPPSLAAYKAARRRLTGAVAHEADNASSESLQM